MPRSVRVAQIAALILAALGVIAIVSLSSMGYSYSAGKLTFAYFPAFGAAITALFFGRGGSGTKVTAIVFGALMILFFLSSMSLAGQEESGGRVVGGEPVAGDDSRVLIVYGAGFGHLAVGILLVVVLAQRVSGDWFRRAR
ncbi:hypothetical protein [Nocardia huaxiensis]|uniref:Uncharacterized protein n=1 Tax=Nocardia huaxiensis TaxID=2755382 RepID=A0A7D6ZK80_9NOCA|nr:hypothetical protein [Nocardia huaxiensis]QLY29643.1 hypothetical protein H0264_31090 [Nocardia huaxiensis]UFS96783.1 hypothetical protein LPY97_02290 [Nocardia huaxiensis]